MNANWLFFLMWGVTFSILTYIAFQYIDPLLIFGGMDCEQVGEVKGCFGYPPTGIAIIAITSAFPAAVISKPILEDE